MNTRDTIITLAVVAAVGFGAYYVWQRSQPQTSLQQASNAQQSTADKKTNKVAETITVVAETVKSTKDALATMGDAFGL